MVDSSSAALLAEINSKAKRIRLWPFAAGASVALVFGMVAGGLPVWSYCVVGALGCGAIYAASLWDRLKKTVVLFYEMEPHFEESYQTVHNMFDRMRACHMAWHVEARGDVHGLYEWKTSGGASSIVRRKSVSFSQGAPPYFKTNVLIPVIPAGRQTLYFFPDRLLVYSAEGVGAVAYEALEIGWADTRFIESDGVPSDASVVGKTWRYVNKSGGPDKRFNDNCEIPIALYGAMQFGSSSGLKELFQLSRTGIGPEFEKAVQTLAGDLNGRAAPSAPGFFTCPCNNCSGHIEFPADGIGQAITCPHCGLETLLFKPAMG
jgi:hypothetical protein